MPPTKPKSTTLNGIEYELFYISELAYALGREAQTIRKWEIAGVIPKTPFKDRAGRRMYTREQIDVATSIAEECHIKQGLSIANTSFSSKLRKAFGELHNKYLGKEVRK